MVAQQRDDEDGEEDDGPNSMGFADGQADDDEDGLDAQFNRQFGGDTNKARHGKMDDVSIDLEDGLHSDDVDHEKEAGSDDEYGQMDDHHPGDEYDDEDEPSH